MGAVNEKNGQVQLIFDLDVFALRMRKAFGYVGDIKLIESQGTTSGAQLQVVWLIRSFLPILFTVSRTLSVRGESS